MPRMCFSYQPDLPPGIGTRAAPPAPRRMPAGTCFSDTVDVPQPASAGYLNCFSYTVDVPQPAPPGLRSMTTTCCFRY
jgi:hypothetical protein